MAKGKSVVPSEVMAATNGDKRLQRQLMVIYQSHPDSKGRGCEFTTPPARSSRKYPWGR
jgi:hypothetical protein